SASGRGGSAGERGPRGGGPGQLQAYRRLVPGAIAAPVCPAPPDPREPVRRRDHPPGPSGAERPGRQPRRLPGRAAPGGPHRGPAPAPARGVRRSPADPPPPAGLGTSLPKGPMTARGPAKRGARWGARSAGYGARSATASSRGTGPRAGPGGDRGPPEPLAFPLPPRAERPLLRTPRCVVPACAPLSTRTTNGPEEDSPAEREGTASPARHPPG